MTHYNDATWDRQAALQFAIWTLRELEQFHQVEISGRDISHITRHRELLQKILATSIARVGQRARAKKARQRQAVRK